MRISNYPTDALTGTELILASNYDTTTQQYSTVNFSVATLKTFITEYLDDSIKKLTFEGSTADEFETTLTVQDPTVDQTIMLPNLAVASGTYWIPVLDADPHTAGTAPRITATIGEINLIDGGTARGTTAVASGDGILINDDGTMRMTNVDTVSTYFASHSVGGTNIVTTGALNAGSITSGFGTIDTGSSAITTTGLISGGSLDIDDVLIDGATIGHTDDTDLLTLASGALTVAGTIASGAITSTAGIAGTTGTFTGDVDITKAGNAVMTVKASAAGSGARLKLKSANNDNGYISFDDNDDTILAQIKAHGSAAPGGTAPYLHRKGLVFNTNGTTTALTLYSDQSAEFAGNVTAGGIKMGLAVADPTRVDLQSAQAITHNDHKGTLLFDAPDAGIADGALSAEITFNNTAIDAEANVIIQMKSNIVADVIVYNIANDSCKFKILNKSGGAIADGTDMDLVYTVINQS